MAGIRLDRMGREHLQKLSSGSHGEEKHHDIAGRVKMFRRERDFGFIAFTGISGSGERGDVYFHKADILDPFKASIHEGDMVIADIIDGKRGLQAVRVRRF